LRRFVAFTGCACASGILELSRVLYAIGLTLQQSDNSFRISFGCFTTDAEIEEAALAVIKCLESNSGKARD